MLEYNDSTKWLNEEMTGLVTQISEVCTMFERKFIKVTAEVLYLYNYYLYKHNNKLFKQLRWLFQNICSNNYTCNNGTYKL